MKSKKRNNTSKKNYRSKKYSTSKKMKGGYKGKSKFNINGGSANNTDTHRICAPITEGGTTCFTKDALLNILKAWNDYYKDNPIQYKSNENKKQLWTKINSKLNSKCNNDYCWTDQPFLNRAKSSLKNEYFRPNMPSKWKKNFNEWLNTLDINKVMKQYEEKYDNFIFIGAVPMDFDYEFNPGTCVVDELCDIDIKKLIKKGKTKLGIVFNLDNHDQDGSHWVSFFSDFDSTDNAHIYYFDSYGIEEPKEIRILMNRMKSQFEALGKKTNIQVNNVRHQFKNSECGVYSINFIVRLLKNEPYDSISNNIIDDDDMANNRNLFFLNTKNI
tara:strand:- start:6103 stop:7089 length:987 start_codon:yes stop_codon:yes gene_type:complete